MFIVFVIYLLSFRPVPEVTIDSYLEKIEDSEIDTTELETMTEKFVSFKKATLLKARENIKGAQNQQRKEYDKRNNTGGYSFKLGQRVLRRNLRRDDRKGDWAQDPWLGPYTIVKFLKFKNKVKCVLRSVLTGKILKQKYSQKNLKPYHSRSTTKVPKLKPAHKKKHTRKVQDNEEDTEEEKDSQRKRKSVWETDESSEETPEVK